MDIENIFYVILAVIYILSKVIKARKGRQTPEVADEPEVTTKKQPTFDDLLKEFTNPGQAKEIENEPKIEPEPATINYDEIRPDDESREIFQKSIDEAARYSEKDEEAEPILFKGFKAYDEDSDDNYFAEEIHEALSSSEGSKKAIVLGEILTRKYN